MENELPLLTDALEKKIAGLPTKPGVYLHKDADGKIIYVGKAKSLRNRVKSYFQVGRPVDAKTKALVQKIADLEVIVTDTEVEALILENTLIKEHKPKYNVLLKDDKSYPYIRITKEEFPKVFKTRRVVRDGSKYFGPYTDGAYLYSLLKTLRSIFPIRSCDLALSEVSIASERWKVCLDYHIKKCEGPCESHISRERYNEYIRQAQQVLNGRTRDLESQLEDRMTALAEELRFEDASIVKGRLERLREYTEKQKVLANDDADRDVFALARAENIACVVGFTIRDGKLIGKRHYFVGNSREQSDDEIIRVTLERWYLEAEHFPDEVLLPCEIHDTEPLLSFLAEIKGNTVEIMIPKIGDKRKLVSMAETNAEVLLQELLLQQALKDQSVPRAVMSLQQDLRMERMPRRIECFDNSHIQGTDYVSSMVVFVDGKPKKSEYRHFKLRSVEGNDDFEAMKEVITRRYGRAIEEGTPMPDLVIIDGGKGQLSHAMEVLASLGLVGSFTVVGLAKRLEEVFTPGSSVPLYLPKVSSSLRLLQQARDEAHRFAVRYHRTLRDKRTFQTELTNITGVGDESAKKLLSIIGSVERVRESTVEQLTEVVGPAMARKIIDHYHSVEKTT
ncbi:MAG: excinuclease ABC subunit UvrC [Candidatus Kapabacteria bacterium]|nr:excinuclease ABC subunit UvrC [Candidatus Kapabacteria bacterium]